jgi:hypothetical protein
MAFECLTDGLADSPLITSLMASLIAPLIRPIEPTLWRALNDNELGSGQVR